MESGRVSLSLAPTTLTGVAMDAFLRAGQQATRQSDAFEEWGALEQEETLQLFLDGLPPTRRRIGKMLASFAFEMALTLVLLFNLIIAILETDAAADDEGAVPTWIFVANVVLLLVYSCEILLRIYAHGRHYRKSWWNWLDVVVVAIDIFLHVIRSAVGNMPNLSIIRTFRLIRLARAFRVSVLFPELNTMLKGMGGAVRTVLWGLILLLSFVGLFSIAAVQLIHPINNTIEYDGCDRCPHAYENVWQAVLTLLQQIVAGDSWGLMTLQIIQAQGWTFFFFLTCLISLNLCVVNLIIAAVVEKATHVYEDENKNMIRLLAIAKQERMREAQQELLKLCYQMDYDKSGTLSLQELLAGFDTDEYFSNLLKSMDMSRDEVAMIFSMFDQDGSGDIDYHEFVNQLHKIKFQEERSLLLWVMNDVRTLVNRFDRSLAAGRRPERPEKPEDATPPAASDAGGSVSGEDEAEELTRIAALVVQAQRTCDLQGGIITSIRASCERLREEQHEDDR